METKKSESFLIVNGGGWIGEKNTCHCETKVNANAMGIEALYPAGTVDEETEKTDLSVNQTGIPHLYPADIDEIK